MASIFVPLPVRVIDVQGYKLRWFVRFEPVDNFIYSALGRFRVIEDTMNVFITQPRWIRSVTVFRKFFWVNRVAIDFTKRLLVENGFFVITTAPWPEINPATSTLLL